MKKILIALVVLMGLSLPASAQIQLNTQAVKVVIPYQMTCSSVQISASAGTEVTGNLTGVSTTTLVTGGKYNSVTIMNLSTTATIYCSHNASVTSSGDLIGWPISYSPVTGPRNWFQWMINPFQKWYCIADGATAVSAQVCLSK